MDNRKQKLLETLDAFVNQRPGMEVREYGDYKLYRQASREVTKDMHDYYAIRGQIAWRDSIDADAIIKASEHAFSGRLTIEELPVQNAGYYGVNAPYFKLSYCVGQYFPTEYRKAACAVLASAWWNVTREDCPDFPINDKGDYIGSNPGEWMRKTASNTFGRGLQRSYFG